MALFSLLQRETVCEVEGIEITEMLPKKEINYSEQKK